MSAGRRRTARRRAESRDLGSHRRGAAGRRARCRSRCWARRSTPLRAELAGAGCERGHRRRRPGARRATPPTATSRRSPRSSASSSRRWSSSRTPTRRATSRRRSPRGSTGRSSPTSPASRRTASGSLYRPPVFQGKLSADVAAVGPRAASRHVPDRRVPRRRGDARRAPPRRCARPPSQIDAATIRQKPEAAVQGSQAGGRSVAGRAHRRGRPRHQGAGAPEARRAARAGAGRRARRVASDLRCRLAADGSPDRQLRARPSRRSSTSRSASPAPSSTSSA